MLELFGLIPRSRAAASDAGLLTSAHRACLIEAPQTSVPSSRCPGGEYDRPASSLSRCQSRDAGESASAKPPMRVLRCGVRVPVTVSSFSINRVCCSASGKRSASSCLCCSTARCEPVDSRFIAFLRCKHGRADASRCAVTPCVCVPNPRTAACRSGAVSRSRHSAFARRPTRSNHAEFLTRKPRGCHVHSWRRVARMIGVPVRPRTSLCISRPTAHPLPESSSRSGAFRHSVTAARIGHLTGISIRGDHVHAPTDSRAFLALGVAAAIPTPGPSEPGLRPGVDAHCFRFGRRGSRGPTVTFTVTVSGTHPDTTVNSGHHRWHGSGWL